MTTLERILAAKMQLMMRQPFFGQLVSYIDFIEITQKIGCDTMGVNAKSQLFYNPKFADSLTKQELLAVICHEILHLVFLHPMRCGTRDPNLWNVAADLKVNQEIQQIEDQDLKLPKDVLLPRGDQWSHGKITVRAISTKNTEQIYQELYDHKDELKDLCRPDIIYVFQPGGNGKDKDGKDTGGAGDVITVDPSQMDNAACDWQAKVNMAAQVAQGRVPAGVMRELDELFNPKLSWKTILRNRFRKMGFKRTWKTPSKKFLPWFFQGKIKTEGIKCVAALDTSGSISQQQITRAFSELWGLCEQFKFIEMYVIICDAQVWSVDRLTNKNKDKLLSIAVKGGGGTAFEPVFDQIKKQLNNQIDSLVFFTDMYGSFPDRGPSYEVIWVTDTKDYKAPFGKTVLITNND